MFTLFLASLLLFGCHVDATNVVGIPTGAVMYTIVCLHYAVYVCDIPIVFAVDCETAVACMHAVVA